MHLHQGFLIGSCPPAFERPRDHGNEEGRRDVPKEERPEDHQLQGPPDLGGKFLADWFWQSSENLRRVSWCALFELPQLCLGQDMAGGGGESRSLCVTPARLCRD